MNHSDAQRLRAAALRKTTISTRTALRRLVIGSAVIVATAGAATPARASADTSEFRGVNWLVYVLTALFIARFLYLGQG